MVLMYEVNCFKDFLNCSQDWSPDYFASSTSLVLLFICQLILSEATPSTAIVKPFQLCLIRHTQIYVRLYLSRVTSCLEGLWVKCHAWQSRSQQWIFTSIRWPHDPHIYWWCRVLGIIFKHRISEVRRVTGFQN